MSIPTFRLVKTTAKAIALTFDDGPHTVYTARAVETLQRFGSQATWFIIGKLAQTRMDLLYEIYQGGNDIGVHAFDHISLTGLSYGQIISQLERTKALITEATGQFWPYFRPPNGAYNQTVLNAAAALGFQYNVLWSVDPRDYESSSSQIASRVLSAIFPGAIVILHEVTAPTTQALPIILDELGRRGYQAVSLNRLLELADSFECRTLVVISPYMRGNDVKAVQATLAAQSYNPGTIDGIYGPQTSNAVSKLQTSNNLPSTGIVDLATYSALNIKCDAGGYRNESQIYYK